MKQTHLVLYMQLRTQMLKLCVLVHLRKCAHNCSQVCRVAAFWSVYRNIPRQCKNALPVKILEREAKKILSTSTPAGVRSACRRSQGAMRSLSSNSCGMRKLDLQVGGDDLARGNPLLVHSLERCHRLVPGGSLAAANQNAVRVQQILHGSALTSQPQKHMPASDALATRRQARRLAVFSRPAPKNNCSVIDTRRGSKYESILQK